MKGSEYVDVESVCPWFVLEVWRHIAVYSRVGVRVKHLEPPFASVVVLVLLLPALGPSSQSYKSCGARAGLRWTGGCGLRAKTCYNVDWRIVCNYPLTRVVCGCGGVSDGLWCVPLQLGWMLIRIGDGWLDCWLTPARQERLENLYALTCKVITVYARSFLSSGVTLDVNVLSACSAASMSFLTFAGLVSTAAVASRHFMVCNLRRASLGLISTFPDCCPWCLPTVGAWKSHRA